MASSLQTLTPPPSPETSPRQSLPAASTSPSPATYSIQAASSSAYPDPPPRITRAPCGAGALAREALHCDPGALAREALRHAHSIRPQPDPQSPPQPTSAKSTPQNPPDTANRFEPPTDGPPRPSKPGNARQQSGEGAPGSRPYLGRQPGLATRSSFQTQKAPPDDSRPKRLYEAR